MLKDDDTRKEYLAVVDGKFDPIKQSCSVPIFESQFVEGYKKFLTLLTTRPPKHGFTTFERIEYDPVSNTSLVRCYPQTGRTHQIRKHLSLLGHPINNDPVYKNVKEFRLLSKLVTGQGPQDGKQTIEPETKTETFQHDYRNHLDELHQCFENIRSELMQKVSSAQEIEGQFCDVCNSQLYEDPDPESLKINLHAYRYFKYSNNTEYARTSVLPSSFTENFRFKG